MQQDFKFCKILHPILQALYISIYEHKTIQVCGVMLRIVLKINIA
jgi:hypothetical protein